MTSQAVARRIDAHHHLWRYSAAEYGWIDAGMALLRRDFLAEEFVDAMRAAGVNGSVVVQARQSIEETRWLLQMARDEPAILGVVGWLPIADQGFPKLLDEFRDEPLLVGLRHVVQAEGKGFLEQDAFNEGIAALCGSGSELVYDLLVVEKQLEEVIRFVDRHPRQSFVLNHLAKPHIAAAEMDDWAARLQELSLRSNVACKLSGMVTEAHWRSWTVEDLRPYFEVALGCFGADRLMAGSDWPVLTLACDYARWWQIVEAWTAPLSPTERAAICGGTATRIYGLPERHLE